jgi:uncharacterized protein
MAASSMNGQAPRRGGQILALACAVVFGLFAALGLGITFFGNSQSGQPVVSIALAPRPVLSKTVSTPPQPPPLPQMPALLETPPGGITPAILSPEEQSALAAPPAGTPQTAAQTAAPPPETPAPPPVALPPVIGGLAIANPEVIEKSPQGALPRIADNGLTPMRAYAVPVAAGNRPRIAIVISGLGISARSTAAAINILPPGVTLAFAPYANDAQRWVALARQKGHEVLLEVPMEPYDFPDSDPGQYTLRTGVGEDLNTRKLTWSLSRFTGYVGVTNLLGGRFLSEAGAVEPMFSALMRRGLLFFDNGSVTRSVAPEVAARVGIPFRQASLTIDSIQAAMEIDHRLSDLETEARSKGSAVGAGFLYPVTVDRVNQWSRSLAGRGLVLAPISSIVAPAKK